MSDPTLLDPRPLTSPTGASAAAELPDDLALEAAGRLQVAALVMIGLWAMGLVVNRLAGRCRRRWSDSCSGASLRRPAGGPPMPPV